MSKEKSFKKVKMILDELGVSSDDVKAHTHVKKSGATVIKISDNENIVINFNSAQTESGKTLDEVSSIDSLDRVAEVLEDMGYMVIPHPDSLHVAVGGSEHPFVAVIMINEKNELVITCQVAKLGDLNEDDVPNVQFFLLDANTRIRPFAFGMITASDNPELDEVEEFPIVLTDSIPLGDLCQKELQCAMDSLLFALKSSDDALRSGLKK